MSIMKVVPKFGMDDLPFGMPRIDVIERLGPPITEQTLVDVDTHPISRRVLNYVDRGFLTTPELGVISITFEAGQTAILLWDTEINCMNPSEFIDFLKVKRCDIRLGKRDSFGGQDVESLGCGIIASFNDYQLESVEVYDPNWRDNRP